ncbi:MAG: hypothetical protein OXT67_13545 [Zetaproteobacteria bacterium]|nr:hypothetical protein [Zetaproteobacteria bacterium]
MELDCFRFVMSKGLCVAHGGGKYCQQANCRNLVKARGFCARHGDVAVKKCQIEDCTRLVRSRGLCVPHGGATKPRRQGCSPVPPVQLAEWITSVGQAASSDVSVVVPKLEYVESILEFVRDFEEMSEGEPQGIAPELALEPEGFVQAEGGLEVEPPL